MGLLKILKEVFIPSSVFEDIIEENLKAQKMKLGMTEYKKWVRKKIAESEATIIMQQEKGLNIPNSWTEKINLLERERKETDRF